MGRCSVLVAEDDAVMRATIELWLNDTDWDVETVADGREAVESLNEDVDILVCDRRMPRLNAEGVLTRLDEAELDIPVIILTAYEPDDGLNEDDVDAYLNKPVKREVLTNVIRRLTRD